MINQKNFLTPNDALERIFISQSFVHMEELAVFYVNIPVSEEFARVDVLELVRWYKHVEHRLGETVQQLRTLSEANMMALISCRPEARTQISNSSPESPSSVSEVSGSTNIGAGCEAMGTIFTGIRWLRQ